jgi:hypothetical protein
MYTPYHLVVGALAEKGMKTRVPTASVALLSHFILDNLLLRHPIIEPVYHIDSPWPEGTPAIIAIVPYPDSILGAVVLRTSLPGDIDSYNSFRSAALLVGNAMGCVTRHY